MSDRPALTDDVSTIKGIGDRKRQLLGSMGIESIDGLLRHYPVKYKDRREPKPVRSAPDDRDVLVRGELMRVQSRMLSGRRPMVECLMRDDGTAFSVVFFNMPYIRKTLSIGTTYLVFGRMRMRGGTRVWTNPEIMKEGSSRDVRGILPVYRTVPGISGQNLAKWIREALASADIGDDWIDSRITEERRLCGREFALNNIHFPQDEAHYKMARYRLIYEQLLAYQLMVRLSRLRIEQSVDDSSVPDADLSPFIGGLPFRLTDGQLKCIRELEHDLISPKPMNRLIQGDVGCGKTVVAEAAIYKCAVSGLQSAMMAPTEILARQHYERLRTDLEQYGIKTVLLVSGMKASERRQTLTEIADGSASVVIGTHAVIQKDVLFRDLALVITDEQHRFGVDQRKTLARKGRGVNVCVMSATPIPRTMAATVFGDMDFSIIRSRPADRKKIITRALIPESRERAYAAVRKELEAGNLAYVIAPSIDSEDSDMSSVTKLYEEIRGRFGGYETALLHGRMSKEDKESVMSDFASGRIRILVATVVVEVGIDVPDATIIVIENSERFGLAQLHQLRGRVGRSDKQSYCYIINYGRSESAAARARALAEIDDGFEISEEDYRLRGPGDIMGTMQSGNVNRNIISLCAYTDILEAAIEDADRIMKDPGRTDFDYVQFVMEEAAGSDNSSIL